jgi:hypothetical protein
MKRNYREIVWKFLTLAISVSLLSIRAVSAQAAEGGYSNYIPGTYGDFAAAVEPPSKLTIRNDIYYYQADGGRSIRSGLLEADADLEFVMNFYIDTGIRLGNLQVRRQDDAFGLGDLTLIPAILFWNRGNFHFALAEYIVTPTGEYDTDDLANTGLNYWTFDTDVAATYLNPETGQDYSINIGYNFNTENSDTDYQTGQELHIDYMINQFLSESWAIGIHGFYLKQVSGDSGDGARLGDFKGEAAGVGPAVLWSTKGLGREVTIIAKWLHEYHAERRIEGDHVFVSFAMGF